MYNVVHLGTFVVTFWNKLLRISVNELILLNMGGSKLDPDDATFKATSNNAIDLLEDVVGLYLAAAHGLVKSFDGQQDGLRQAF